MFWTRSREVRSLPESMSIREILLSCREGASRMSEHRLRVKTALPAPIMVIFGTCAPFPRGQLPLDVTRARRQDQGQTDPIPGSSGRSTELLVVEAAVEAVANHELVVVSDLGDDAVLDDGDLVRVADGR